MGPQPDDLRGIGAGARRPRGRGLTGAPLAAAAALALLVRPGPPAPVGASTGPVADGSVSSVQAADLDAAFAAFWAAADPRAAAVAGHDIVALEPSFEEVLRRLRAGPPPDPEAPTGRTLLRRKGSGGLEHPWVLDVPENHDPIRAYPVRVFLHGGVARPRRDGDGGWWREPDRVTGDDHLSVFPYSWEDSLWWQASQVENLREILWRLRRTHRVDANRIHLIGVSDGGTGAWFQAFRDPTPWASFLVFIAHPAVLSNPRIGTDGQLFVPNLRNRPFLVINGGLDRLYPISSVLPYLLLFEETGVPVQFVGKPDAGHTTSWWPEEAERIEAFIEGHPRDPHPDALSWETDRTDRYARVHWLLIDELGHVPGESDLADPNTVSMSQPPTLGVRLAEAGGQGVRLAQVDPGSPAGRAGLRDGDVVVRAAGSAVSTVAALQLLLGRFGYGAEIAFVVDRDGERVETLVAIPDRAEPRQLMAFPRDGPSGRVEARRQDNEVTLQTRGVRRVTLLLSPDELDLSRPVRVVANGAEVYSGTVTPRVETLLEWAARDADPSMLFAAELPVDLGAAAR